MADEALEIPDLLAYALYEADERAAQSQVPLYVFLASLALYRAATGLTQSELVGSVSDLLPAPNLDANCITEAIKSGLAQGRFIKEAADRLQVSAERRAELDDAANQFTEHADAFHRQILVSVEQETGLALENADAQDLRDGLEAYLQRLFHAHSVSLGHAFSSRGSGFDEGMEPIQERKLATLVNSLVPSNEKLRRRQYQFGIRDGLLNLDEAGRRHIASLYQKTVAFALLKQDPNVHRVKRTLARSRVAYLDTNVVMAWMFEAHPNHELAEHVVELAVSVGCSLQVSRFTLDELSLQLEESDNKFKRLSAYDQALAIVDDDVLRTFHQRTLDSVGLTWPAFLANFSPPEPWLKDHGVVCDEHQDWANAIHDTRKDDVFKALRGVKRGPRALIDFDAHNLLYIQLRRVQWRSDAMGNRVWFVTLDRTLKRAEATLIRERVYGAPSSHEARAWCEFMGPYAAPDSAELDAYVEHLVTSELGLIGENPKLVDANFLATLQESRFDIDDLLSAGPERARQVLVRLQEDREVRRLLDSTEEEREAPAWSKELTLAIDRALKELEPDRVVIDGLAEAQRERDKALLAVEDAKRDRDQALRRAADLERAQQQLQGRLDAVEEQQKLALERKGIFSRLREWFSGN